MFDIRPAVASDAPMLLQFIQELAEFEKAPHEVTATVESFEATLFSENPAAHALICEFQGKPAGYAVYFFNYSTWQGKTGLYLEDLYITPEFRGKGGGKVLLKALAQIAVNKDCGRFEWSVLDWNTPAIKAYDAVGALPQPEWLRYRMDGDALKNFARD